jgi:hypothetical protein
MFPGVIDAGFDRRCHRPTTLVRSDNALVSVSCLNQNQAVLGYLNEARIVSGIGSVQNLSHIRSCDGLFHIGAAGSSGTTYRIFRTFRIAGSSKLGKDRSNEKTMD